MKGFFLIPPSNPYGDIITRQSSDIHWVNQYGGNLCEVETTPEEINRLSGYLCGVLPCNPDPDDLDAIPIEGAYYLLPKTEANPREEKMSDLINLRAGKDFRYQE